MKISSLAALALTLSLMFASFSSRCDASPPPIRVGFYEGKCSLFDVEAIVSAVVKAKFILDPSITPALMRMQFHDCFVNGCDASILLDGPEAEKTAIPNRSVRGFDVIDAAKEEVERFCPGVVSCADIIIMATRDAIELSGGGRYAVETGRKDGLVSLATNVNLPSLNFTVSESIDAFGRKGLDVTDMIYLLGGHTVGIVHCFLFQNRLYNYKNTGNADPSMDPMLVEQLRGACPLGSNGQNTVNLDQNPTSSMTIDNSFFRQIVLHRGILQIDQDIALDMQTRGTVEAIAAGNDFNTKFGEAMVKLGGVEVLSGMQGEIRTSCRAVNNPAS